MRPSVMLGIALIVIGGTVFLRGLSAPRTNITVGDLSVSAEERSTTTPWLVGIALLAGVVLVTSGTRRKA
jgi:hypothetical protein